MLDMCHLHKNQPKVAKAIERLIEERDAALGRVTDLDGQLERMHDEAAELIDMLCQHMRVSPESIRATVRSRLKPIESKEGGA